MWILLVTLVCASLMIVLTHGRFAELGRVRVRATPLLFGGLALQIAIELIVFAPDQIETIGYGLLMASFALILGFCLFNLGTRGFGVIAVGVAMNALVVGVNQGMPTIPVGNDAQGHRVQKPFEPTVKHRPEEPGDHLTFLDDRIVLPKPFDTVVSFGDLVLAVGICELAYYGSRRRYRRPGRPALSQESVGTNPHSASTRSSAPNT